MRNGMSFTPAWKTQVNATLATSPNDPANLNRANVEFPQSLFYDRNLANELLFEINFELRLARIAQSREEARHRKVSAASYLQLVCVDGKPVNSVIELTALDQTFLAAVASLRVWIHRCTADFRET
jgi:hypothetical protein